MTPSGGTGSLSTSSTSYGSFHNQFMAPSFGDLFGDNKQDLNNSSSNVQEAASSFKSQVPKFKSFPPAALPISPAPVSPSSYLVFPPSLSPSVLLDSPVLFANSNTIPSPTTGAFSVPVPKEEENKSSDFSFQSQSTSLSSRIEVSASTHSSVQQDFFIKQPQQSRTFDKQSVSADSSVERSSDRDPKLASSQNFSLQTNFFHGGQYSQPPPHYLREQKKSEDGYNWRKYGQKQVKGSENPRSYYKCTFPNCPTKKKVERNLDGHITEIVYKGNHNHPKPQTVRRSSSQPVQHPAYPTPEVSSFSETIQVDSFLTPENSSASFGDDDFDHTSPINNSKDGDEIEPEAKRWKGESENEAISACGSRAVREPRIVVQTTSDIDILDDGYRWRKYGQKVVKGNPNPRSYYKCTYTGCPVRKHVERASHDLRAVITTYEGKHNHDVPAARGSSGYAINRTSTTKNGSDLLPNLSSLGPNNHATHGTSYLKSLQNTVPKAHSQAPFPLQMSNSGGYGIPENTVGSNMTQMQQIGNSFNIAKKEPKDDYFFGFFP